MISTLLEGQFQQAPRVGWAAEIRIDIPRAFYPAKVMETVKVSFRIFGTALATAISSRCPQGGGHDVAV